MGFRYRRNTSITGVRASPLRLFSLANTGDSAKRWRIHSPTARRIKLRRNGTRHPHARNVASG